LEEALLRRSKAEIRGEERRIHNRMSLFREFEDKAKICLEESGMQIDDAEDVQRVTNIFLEGITDNGQLRRMVHRLSILGSKTSKDFVNEFKLFINWPAGDILKKDKGRRGRSFSKT